MTWPTAASSSERSRGSVLPYEVGVTSTLNCFRSGAISRFPLCSPAWIIDHRCLSVALHNQLAKALLFNRAVVVAGVAWIDEEHDEVFGAGVHRAMRPARGDINHPPRSHLFRRPIAFRGLHYHHAL